MLHPFGPIGPHLVAGPIWGHARAHNISAVVEIQHVLVLGWPPGFEDCSIGRNAMSKDQCHCRAPLDHVIEELLPVMVDVEVEGVEEVADALCHPVVQRGRSSSTITNNRFLMR